MHFTHLLYNQPKLCPDATWNVNASTFANNSIVYSLPHGIFIDLDDKIFFAAYFNNQTLIWPTSGYYPVPNPTMNLAEYTTLFVSINGDIYFENSNEIGRIDKWNIYTNSSELVTIFDDSCYGLFIDINNTLYCSMEPQNRVVSILLNNNANNFTTIAGNGSRGSASNQLDSPWGIFVDINFDLYVADANNSRIQLFQPGQLNGTTVAGTGIPNNLKLHFPTDVVLDADGYLFIADNANNRIIRAGSTDYYCVAACSDYPGSGAAQLNKPYSLRFDSQGNIYVADEFNLRIQKFMLTTNSCETSTTATLTNDPVMSSSSTIQDQTTYHYEHSTTNEVALTANTRDELASTTNTEDLKITTVETSIFQSGLHSFVPPTCSDPSCIGINCNISNTPCDTIQPCQNNGICNNINTVFFGYICSCSSGFNGIQCQFDNRPCKFNTCWNNGTCEELSNTTFVCRCEEGWEGIHCETKVNYCENVTCLNNGVCRPLFRDYKCECLGESFSGRHCETTSTKTKTYQIVSTSFSYVAITAMISVVMFIVIMDILKYCFRIDPIRKELKQNRRKKQSRKHKPVIQRFVYVNSPPAAPTSFNEQTDP